MARQCRLGTRHPWTPTRSVHVVVFPVRSLAVGQPEPPRVRQCEDTLQPLCLGDQQQINRPCQFIEDQCLSPSDACKEDDAYDHAIRRTDSCDPLKCSGAAH